MVDGRVQPRKLQASGWVQEWARMGAIPVDDRRRLIRDSMNSKIDESCTGACLEVRLERWSMLLR